MKPAIGRTVIVLGIPSNGAVEAPAVITRVWSSHDTASGPVAVNLTIFPDNAPPIAKASVMLFDTALQAQQVRGANPGAICAHWPERA
jgi:hypothetical protein